MTDRQLAMPAVTPAMKHELQAGRLVCERLAGGG